MTSKNITEKDVEVTGDLEELALLKMKLQTATDFLRWLANYAKGDWDLRRRTVQTLKSMDAWDQ